MFDLKELGNLKALGAVRVRYADGAEVEFDVGWGLRAGANPAGDPQQDAAPAPPEEMPSRAALRKLASELVVIDGAEGPVTP